MLLLGGHFRVAWTHQGTSCLYPPTFREGAFSEVRIQDPAWFESIGWGFRRFPGLTRKVRRHMCQQRIKIRDNDSVEPAAGYKSPLTSTASARGHQPGGRNPKWEARTLARCLYRKSEEGKIGYDEGILI